MTLRQVIRLFEVIASKEPSVNMIVENDIFRLNEYADARYGVFGWTQGQHSYTMDEANNRLRFTFFYVDRLTEDKSNEIEIQSVGMKTLTNIARLMNESGLFVDSLTFQPFNQRFEDECAGVFASVEISAPVDSMCGDNLVDFNEDFNEDFLIY